MPAFIEMPRLNDTMEEGTLAAWHVKVGDKLSSGDAICDIETDKATQELQAFEDGTVAKLLLEPDTTVATGTVIAILAVEGESVEDAAKAEVPAAAAAPAAEEKKEAPKPAPAPVAPAAPAAPAAAAPPTPAPVAKGGVIKASPVAVKLAAQNQIDLTQLKGTGPAGRIIKRDVLKAAKAGIAKLGSGGGGGGAKKPSGPKLPAVDLASGSEPVSKMRGVIAKRLVDSKQQAPHFQVSVDVRADKLGELREGANLMLAAEGVKISVNDLVVRATALAAARHPGINSSWMGDTIVRHGTVNVGVAVSLPAESGGGLVVATVRDVQVKGLREISGEIKGLAKQARTKGLSVEQMSDSTITVSNLGMPQYGVVQFNPIINTPNACILGIGAAIEKPVVENGQLVVGTVMNITLSGDHRVIDGAVAAEFLATLKALIENPASLLV